MDPLSEVLSLIRPESLVSGGFSILGPASISFGRHSGVKCYAMISGVCWIQLQGAAAPMLLSAGDCYVLPRGVPFSITTDTSLTPVAFQDPRANGKFVRTAPPSDGSCYIAGGHFDLHGPAAHLLIDSLPSIVHIKEEVDRAAIRWSLDRISDELRDAKPGCSLLTQQLAYTMLIQALRIYLSSPDRPANWFSALTDTHMRAAVECIHGQPGHRWTLQELASRVGMSRSAFARRFKQTIGITPMEYLTRWRMLRASERIRSSDDSLAVIAATFGYDSESAFGKAFRRSIGCSPRRYGRLASNA